MEQNYPKLRFSKARFTQPPTNYLILVTVSVGIAKGPSFLPLFNLLLKLVLLPTPGSSPFDLPRGGTPSTVLETSEEAWEVNAKIRTHHKLRCILKCFVYLLKIILKLILIIKVRL